jgi:hypothetical protein
MASHIIHLAVKTLPQPLEQAWFGGGQIDIGDANRLKTDLPAPLFDPGG